MLILGGGPNSKTLILKKNDNSKCPKTLILDLETLILELQTLFLGLILNFDSRDFALIAIFESIIFALILYAEFTNFMC